MEQENIEMIKKHNEIEHTIKGVIKSCYENNINFLAKIGYLKNDEPNQ